MLVLCLLIPIVFVGFTLNLSSVSAESDTTIYIDPTPVIAKVCQNFTIAVNVKDVTDLYAWQLKLSWNPDLLECVGYSFGPFLPPPTIQPPPIINNTAGWILAGDSRMMPPGVSGNGTVFYIEFHCDGAGECDLVFSDPDTFLLDSSAMEIPCSEINGHVIQTEAITRYLHKEEPLVPVHLHNEESLVPIHMNSNMTLTPVHMHYVGDPFIDPIYEPWFTPWHELCPEFCQEWILTSWEDNGDGILSPNDQIDMSDPTELYMAWYHVDRITWTVLLTNETDPDDQMYVEYKGTFEPIEDPINYPVCTFWHEVYPSYSNVYHIISATGPLEWCTYIALERFVNGTPTGEISSWHVEEVVRDLILREKIMDPICTWWHEIYPDYCKWWHITSWEDNQLEGDPGYGQLSPCDQIDMVDPYFERWETFWSMGDVNRDGLIDILDVELIQKAWGSTPGDPNWNPDADLNQDGIVSAKDLIVCAANQGLDIWTYFGVPGPRSKKEWYHVDRVTLTLNVTFGEPLEWMKIELKTYYFEEMYNALKHPIETRWHEVYPHYSNVYTLTRWDWFLDDNCNGVLDVCDYIWLLNETSGIGGRYHVEDICYDLILNKKVANPVCTDWHELHPEYCQGWHLTSWEDNDDDILSPCDQIDMLTAEDFEKWETFWSMGDTDRDGYIDDDDVDYVEMWFGWHGPPGVHRADFNKDGDVDVGDAMTCALNYGKDIWTYYPELGGKTWYHVDRVTLTLNISTPEGFWLIEYKGPFEGMYEVKTAPIGTKWHVVYPYYSEIMYIDDWYDNCNGVLDHCDYVQLWGAWCHVEDLAIDLILNEKITDPTCTIWHEIYPEYCNKYHIVDWEDNDDGLLSPCDQIKMTLQPEGPTKEYHVDYVTLTINITDPSVPGWWMLLEYYYEGSVETMYWVKTHPVGSWWFEPGWIGPMHEIQDWSDNCNGVLDYCDYVMFYDYWYHIEDVTVDIIVTEKIHDVAVTAVSSRYPFVYQGHIDPIDVTITNLGDFNEPTVDVYAYYDGNLAAPKQTTSLNIGETKTLTFNWDTTGIPPGFYTVSANATIAIDNDPSNNVLTGNTEEVKQLPPWWFTKKPYPDYAPSGMPDIDQKQDVWGLGAGVYTWCGPVAVANSLWWFDSKYESMYNPTPLPPPAISDSFPLVWAYGAWDDHDPLNVDPLVRELAFLMDTDGQRTGLQHIGTNYIDMETGLSQYLQIHGINPTGDCDGDGDVDDDDLNIIANAMGTVPGVPGWDMRADIVIDNIVDLLDLDMAMANYGLTGLFYEHTVDFPDFYWIEEEIYRSEDVVLFLEFWIEIGPGEWIQFYEEPSLEGGHFVTCAGVNSTTEELLISDPYWDAAEAGFWGDVPVPHPSPHPSNLHNDAQFVSHDAYPVLNWISPPMPPNPYGPPVWELVNYLQQLGYPLNYHAFIRAAIVTSPLAEHNVAVINVTTSKTGCIPMPTVGQNLTCRVNVTVENQGGFAETFNVTAYANSTEIGTQEITLDPAENVTLAFTWNTSGLVKGNYSIWAYAWPVEGETNTTDNTFAGDWIIVTIQGDINGDNTVNFLDAILLGTAFGSKPGDPNWNPNANINDDGIINFLDAIILGAHFGQTDP